MKKQFAVLAVTIAMTAVGVGVSLAQTGIFQVTQNLSPSGPSESATTQASTAEPGKASAEQEWTRQEGLDWWNSLPSNEDKTRVDLGDGLTVYVDEETGATSHWGNVTDEVSKNPFKYADALAGQLIIDGSGHYGRMDITWDPGVGKRTSTGRVVVAGESPKDFSGWVLRGHAASAQNFDAGDASLLFEIDGSQIKTGPNVAPLNVLSNPVPICQKYFVKLSLVSKTDSRVLELNPQVADFTWHQWCDRIFATVDKFNVSYAGKDRIQVDGKLLVQSKCVTARGGTYVYFRGQNSAFSSKEVFLQANLDLASNIETVDFEAAYLSELEITPGTYEAGMTLYNCSGNYASIKLGEFEVLDK